eukprot:6210014-Pleurochrysis_carterae.AAC.2
MGTKAADDAHASGSGCDDDDVDVDLDADADACACRSFLSTTSERSRGAVPRSREGSRRQTSTPETTRSTNITKRRRKKAHRNRPYWPWDPHCKSIDIIMQNAGLRSLVRKTATDLEALYSFPLFATCCARVSEAASSLGTKHLCSFGNVRQ